MNLWKNMEAERQKQQIDKGATNVIIFGGHKSGKSSVIRTLLNEDAPTECTVGLSYSYYRSKGGRNFNLWEIGGELNVSGRNMALVPLEHSKSVVLVLLIDLATLSQIEDLIKKLGKFNAALKNKNVKPAIVANKYDQLSFLKSDIKSAVNEFLKVSSKYLKASLIQCCCSQESQKTILRRFFQSEVFGISSPSLAENSTDDSQPLVLLNRAQRVTVNSTVDSAAIELAQVVEQERIKSSSISKQPENMENFADNEIDAAVKHFNNHREYSKLSRIS